MKPSQVIDQLADVYLVVLHSRSLEERFGLRGAVVKLWRFMRPEVPGQLSSAQHHTAWRLLVWAEQALQEAPDNPKTRTELASAISHAAGALRYEPPPAQARRRTRGPRKG